MNSARVTTPSSEVCELVMEELPDVMEGPVFYVNIRLVFLLSLLVFYLFIYCVVEHLLRILKKFTVV